MALYSSFTTLVCQAKINSRNKWVIYTEQLNNWSYWGTDHGNQKKKEILQNNIEKVLS